MNMIAGCGFARMAWGLAQSRTRRNCNPWPYDRAWARITGHGPTFEYYRILDDVSDRWARTANQIRLGASTSNWRMQL